MGSPAWAAAGTGPEAATGAVGHTSPVPMPVLRPSAFGSPGLCGLGAGGLYLPCSEMPLAVGRAVPAQRSPVSGLSPAPPDPARWLSFPCPSLLTGTCQELSGEYFLSHLAWPSSQSWPT